MTTATDSGADIILIDIEIVFTVFSMLMKQYFCDRVWK